MTDHLTICHGVDCNSGEYGDVVVAVVIMVVVTAIEVEVVCVNVTMMKTVVMRHQW